MRPLSSILVVLILAVAPIKVANAQSSNPLLNVPSPMPNPSPPPRPAPSPAPLQNPLLNLPAPLPDPNAALQGRIPAPLPTPLQAPAINGPSTLPDVTALPAQPPLLGAPVTPPAPPSVFQSQTGL
jgi:hypothetical protein